MVKLNDAAHWKLDVGAMTTCFWRSRHIGRSSMPSGKHHSLRAAPRPNGANQTCDKSLRAAAATQTYWPVPSLAWFICSPDGLSELKQTGVSLTGGDRATALQPLSARSSRTPLFIWASLALAEWSGLLLTQNQIKSLISWSVERMQHETPHCVMHKQWKKKKDIYTSSEIHY